MRFPVLLLLLAALTCRLRTAIAADSAVPGANAPATPDSTGFAVGADLSFLKQAEDRGVVFKDAGRGAPGLDLFRHHGYNWIRLRLFNHPDRLPNDLAYTTATAKAAKERGYRFLLDFHYSDTWADPGKQILPRAWEKKTHEELVQAVFEFTRDSITALRAGGAAPDMVQLGNEVIAGMLWPDGKLPQNWDHFADLVRAGARGVAEARGDAPAPKIMIHIDRGGDARTTKWFFDKFNPYGIPYDVIGLSYYPFWHGSIEELRSNLAQTAEAYGKEIIVVEAAYNWRPAEYRGKTAPFPESPGGQEEFLEAVTRAVLSTPNHLGRGVFWWEPAVEPTTGLGSRSFFDREGSALPALTVFDGGWARLLPVRAPAASNAATTNGAPPGPRLFLIGDSTVRNGTRGQVGWGDPLAGLFDPARITVLNRALGGRSSRTYLNEGLWEKVRAELRPGDFVLMQFGHNDGGPLDDARARASLKGDGDDWQIVTNRASGRVETVHSYGWYLRKYITDAKARGASPIVLSPVPRKIWQGDRIARASGDYGKWAAAAAAATAVPFVDLNDRIARKYEELGREKVDKLFADEHTHTTPEGAALNAACVVEGVKALPAVQLKEFLREGR